MFREPPWSVQRPVMILRLKTFGSPSPTWAALPVSGYSVIFQQKDLSLPILELPKSSSIFLSSSFSFLILSPSASCSHTCRSQDVSTGSVNWANGPRYQGSTWGHSRAPAVTRWCSKTPNLLSWLIKWSDPLSRSPQPDRSAGAIAEVEHSGPVDVKDGVEAGPVPVEHDDGVIPPLRLILITVTQHLLQTGSSQQLSDPPEKEYLLESPSRSPHLEAGSVA